MEQKNHTRIQQLFDCQIGAWSRKTIQESSNYLIVRSGLGAEKPYKNPATIFWSDRGWEQKNHTRSQKSFGKHCSEQFSPHKPSIRPSTSTIVNELPFRLRPSTSESTIIRASASTIADRLPIRLRPSTIELTIIRLSTSTIVY